jgi:hypothetical protein
MGTKPVNSLKRVNPRDKYRSSRDEPLKRVEDANERICEKEIIMDELTIGTTSAFGDTPAENLSGTGKDL